MMALRCVLMLWVGLAAGQLRVEVHPQSSSFTVYVDNEVWATSTTPQAFFDGAYHHEFDFVNQTNYQGNGALGSYNSKCITPTLSTLP